MPSRSTPALDLLARSGVPHTVRPYEVAGRESGDRGDRRSYGLDAAAALGVTPGRVFKTLVASVEGRLVVAIVPADAEVDLKALAALFGGRRAELADATVAERASGSVVGGISPLALRRPMPAALDESAAEYPAILVSAGRRGLQVELAPSDLVTLSGAVVARIARRR